MKYNRTSLAYNIEEYTEVDELVNEARKTTAGKNKKTKLLVFICAVYVISMIASLLFKTADINEQKDALIKLQASYNEILNENKKLEVSINSQIDLRKVEEIAIAQLGMNKPKKSQTVYISTEPKDYGEVFLNNSESESKGNILASILKSLKGIFAYSN